MIGEKKIIDSLTNNKIFENVVYSMVKNRYEYENESKDDL